MLVRRSVGRVTWELVLLGFAAGLAISTLTAPVGVSGAVFLLPVQLDVLRVPSPAVTPTNLLFNVVATPGPLLRYRAQGSSAARLPAGSSRPHCPASWPAPSFGCTWYPTSRCSG